MPFSVQYFSFNQYYAMPDKFTESTKYYGRELNKDCTEKGIYAPDFIKIEDGSLEIENYDIFNVECIVNKL